MRSCAYAWVSKQTWMIDINLKIGGGVACAAEFLYYTFFYIIQIFYISVDVLELETDRIWHRLNGIAVASDNTTAASQNLSMGDSCKLSAVV